MLVTVPPSIDTFLIRVVRHAGGLPVTLCVTVEGTLSRQACTILSTANTTSKTGEHAVAQLVEALGYKPEGCGFDSRWCHWNFSLT